MTARKKTATPAADSLASVTAAETAKAAEFAERLDGLSAQMRQAADSAQTVEGQKALVEVMSRVLTAESAYNLREISRKQREARAAKAEATKK
jgi:hypothetical protein